MCVGRFISKRISPPPAGVDRANIDDEDAERFDDVALVEDLYTLGADRGDRQSGKKGSGAEDQGRRGGRIISMVRGFGEPAPQRKIWGPAP